MILLALAMDALYIKVMDYENEWEVKTEYDMYCHCHLHENNAYLVASGNLCALAKNTNYAKPWAVFGPFNPLFI
jgi:hypothetical protein